MALEQFGMSALRPDDVTSRGLPVVMRGYDREGVDRLLARVAEAYALTLRQSLSQRERLRSLEADLAAAEGEAAATRRPSMGARPSPSCRSAANSCNVRRM